MPEPLTNNTSVAAAATTPATADAGQPAKGNKAAAVAKTDDAIVAPAMGAYKVAPGRHLVHGEDHVFENGAVKKKGRVRDYAPGDEIELDADEAERFMKLGFILDEDGAIVVRADGPAVNVEDGVQISGA